MAYYAALASVVQLLKDISLHDRYSNSFPDKQQIHASLYAKFNRLQERLDDYSPEDPKEANDILERRIRDAAYCVQDMIESRISTLILPHVHLEKRTHGVERLRRHLASAFRKPLDSITEKKYYRGLEKAKREVESIVEELMRIKVESNKTHEGVQPNQYTSAQASNVQASSGKNTMLVFHEDLRITIKDQLCGQSSKLEVISIAGMGGLGKTTLARYVFDDQLIHDHFDCRVWVTVSQNYHLKDILLAIVDSPNITKEELCKARENELKDRTYKKLFGRRYLIVMDDVWEAKLWDDSRRAFPDISNGSRIMITTRLSDVADYVSSSNFHHQMQFLDEEQSWTLLREKLFSAQEHCPNELEVIGKLIAKNCRGLPLAIVVIAGVLSNVKRGRDDWGNIARKVSSAVVDQNDQHLLKILSLSYNHLPHHLKPCFLYFGGYPEDHEIRISELIRFWIAEGFLKPIGSKSLEKVGEEYFKDLVNRNLVLITKKNSIGRFKSCIIHDVLRDLCSKRARDQNFLLCVQRKDNFRRVPMGNVRRVYVHTLGEYFEILKYIKKYGSHVRSLIKCYSKFHADEVSLSAASGCKLLRILDTYAWSRSEADEHSMTKLFHLRYLKLKVESTHMPSRISHLQNLQTLILDGSDISLPSEIWKMPQLRHVMSKFMIRLPRIPYGEVRIIDGAPLLGNLQTLWSVGMFRFTGNTIKMMPNLKKLGFYCSGKVVQKWDKYKLRNLVHLHQLETLYIEFNISTQDAIPLSENFVFPWTLKKLTLYGCQLPWKDMSVVGSLPNLQVLKLICDAFVGEEWETIEGEFLKLKSLQMSELVSLQYWRAENTHFPLLEHLHIKYCNALEEIPPGIGDIPTLQLIELTVSYEGNPALESKALEIQQQQRDLGNDDLQVRVRSL